MELLPTIRCRLRFLKLPCLNFFGHDKIMRFAPARPCPACAAGNFVISSAGRVSMTALQAGVEAPDFELPAVTGKQRHKFKLSDFRGKKNVVVAFYPLDWSPT